MLRFRSFPSHSPIGIVLVTWLASPIRVSSALASLGSFCSAKSHCLGLSLCDTLGIEPLGDLIPIGEQKSPQTLYFSGFAGFSKPFPDRDSNPNQRNQNPLCYHYTIRE